MGYDKSLKEFCDVSINVDNGSVFFWTHFAEGYYWVFRERSPGKFTTRSSTGRWVARPVHMFLPSALDTIIKMDGHYYFFSVKKNDENTSLMCCLEKKVGKTMINPLPFVFLERFCQCADLAGWPRRDWLGAEEENIPTHHLCRQGIFPAGKSAFYLQRCAVKWSE